MKQLNNRQQKILDLIYQHGPVSNKEILDHINTPTETHSRITIVRDLEHLLNETLIERKGAGRGTIYQALKNSQLLRPINPDSYFEIDIDKRESLERFNIDIFKNFSTLFSSMELTHLNKLTKIYQHNLSHINPYQRLKEIERLTIELSWKSSQIEGNTYSLLDTEALIKDNRVAPNTTPDEATMILNHKNAIDYIFEDPSEFKKLTTAKIENIHILLMNNLNIPKGLRDGTVRITGSKFIPLDNKHQIKDSIEKLIKVVNSYEDAFHRALVSIAMISYIQPFVDGNKRTGRLTGNALLLCQNCCPLSYRSVDPVDYKKAMLLFYEQNSIVAFKELFISQYEFSVNNYFTS